MTLPAPAAAPAPVAAPPSGAPRGWRRDALPLAAIAALGFLAYSNAFGGAFVYDDIRQIRDNLLVRDLANFLPGRYFGQPTRWLGYLTFAVNHRVGGLATFGFHLVNVVIHVANALLVHALVRVTFRTPRLRGSRLASSSGAIAFAAAALFVAHPLATQAVAYVVQRFTSLATTGYLATVVLYARWRLGEGPPRPLARTLAGGAAVVACALLTALTKEIAFTLPLAVALYEASFLDGPWRRRLARLAPVLATLPAVPLLAIAERTRDGVLPGLAAVTRVDTPLPRLDYAITQLVVVTRYLGLLVFPAGQSVDHDVAVRRSLLDPGVPSALAVLAALVVLAAFLYRRTRAAAPRPLDPAARLAAFGVAWFFLALSVESSLIPISDVMYEHRAYLPSAGLLVAAAVGLAALARRARPAAAAQATVVVASLLAVVLAAATLARNLVWADDLSLWSDAALQAPGKPRPFLNLGTALSFAGEKELGARALRQAVRLDPSSTYARAQLAAALVGLGQDAEAEPELRGVLAAEPRDPETLFNLAQLLWRSGRRDEARALFARFVEVAPPAYEQARRLAAARAAAAPPPDARGTLR